MRHFFGISRVSTDQQRDEGNSFETQHSIIKKIADYIGMPVTTYFDDTCSGAVAFANRPEGGKLLAILQPGDHVAASRLTRVGRSAIDILETVRSFKAVSYTHLTLPTNREV